MLSICRAHVAFVLKQFNCFRRIPPARLWEFALAKLCYVEMPLQTQLDVEAGKWVDIKGVQGVKVCLQKLPGVQAALRKRLFS